MVKHSACPDIKKYESLACGRLPPDELDLLVQHLEGCSECTARVQTLNQADTLIDVVRRAGTPFPQPPEEIVAKVIQRLSDLVGKRVDAASTERKPVSPAAKSVQKSAFAAGEDSDEEDWRALLAPPQAAGELGRLGSYRVLEVLGTGGMGVVFKAEDQQLQRLVALKAMLPSVAARASSRQRFLREARAAAALKHDHIVGIYQVGEDRGFPFIAMEFLAGESLDDRLKRENVLPIAEAVRIGREVAEGLSAAHARNLIHRDIKPANVWLETRGERKAPRSEQTAVAPRVKILDFGLARSTGEATQLTQEGAMLGTPGYMAPEQAKGEAVDHRCDLFSLGCLLYRMVTGSTPFGGKDAVSALLALVMEDAIPADKINPAIPGRLSRIIMKLLAKDPAKRFMSAEEVLAALQKVHDFSPETPVSHRPGPPPVKKAPVAARETSTRGWAERRPRRRRWAAIATVLGLAAALVLAVVIIIPTGNGTLTIRTDGDKDVEIVIRQGGEVVCRLGNKQEIRLPVGLYKAELGGGMEGFHLEASDYTLKRGERVVVRVTFKPEPPMPDLTPPKVTNPPKLDLANPVHYLEGHSGPVLAVAVCEDGKSFYSAGADGICRRWHTETRKEISSFRFTPPQVTSQAVLFSPTGRYFLSAGRDDRLCIWSVDKENELAVMKTTIKPVDELLPHAFAVSSDGRRILHGLINAQVHLVDESGKELQAYEGHKKKVTAVAFSPDGSRIASGSEDSSVRLWDTASRQQLKVLQGHNGLISFLGFSRDGKQVVSGGSRMGSVFDRTVRVWDCETGKQLHSFSGHTKHIAAADVSPDGRLVVSGSFDHTLRLWDASNGQEIDRLSGNGAFMSVTFADDGGQVYAANQDGKVYLWKPKVKERAGSTKKLATSEK